MPMKWLAADFETRVELMAASITIALTLTA